MAGPDYAHIVANSERVSWTVDKVLADTRPDLTRRFLPEALACVDGLTCLEPRERLVLALLRFADEELKHQQMFLEFCERYRAASGVACGLLESRATSEDVAAAVILNAPLAVMITVLHIEWVSQRHYVEAVHGSSENLDPMFVGLLKAHWLEEAQHTKIDLLVIDKLLEKASPADIERAIDDYLELGKQIDGLLYMQMELDVATLERAIGRTLDVVDRETVVVAQATACRRALLWLGMTNPAFVEFLGKLSTSGAARVAQAAAAMAPV